MIKRVAIFSSTRGDMSILSPLLFRMKKEKGIRPLFFVGGTHLKERYGMTINELNKIKINDRFDYLSNGEKQISFVKSLANAHLTIGRIFEKYKFDYVCILGDRFEKLAIANNAILYNKPIIHLHGGEKTEGVIDDQIRHMITKASHLHFVICRQYKNNIIKMGENKNRVFNFGSLAIENIKNLKKIDKKKLFKSLKINPFKPLAILTYHPVTLEKKKSTLEQIKNIFLALKKYNIQVMVTAPGHEKGRNIIDNFIKKNLKKNRKLIYTKSLGSEKLFNLIPYARFVIGNSSSSIIEVPYFKIPTINIGDRQKGRFFHKSVINCDYTINQISKSIDLALSKKFLKKIKKMKYKFGNGNTSTKIIKIIKKIDINENLIRKK